MIEKVENGIRNIKFFKNKDIKLEKIDLGHSGAFTYYVLVDDKEYFLKIISGYDIDKIEKVYDDYVESNINIAKLFEYGKIDNDLSYFIWDSLGRETLKSRLDEMSLEEIYNTGVFIGKENLKLENNHSNKANSNELSSIYTDTIIEYYTEFLSLLEENKQYFTDEEYSILTNYKLKELLDYELTLIKSEKVIYCHNDIKTNNVMFKDDELYFIDIENTCENFFYRTLGANIFTIFPKTNEKYAEFYNGVFAGFYNFDIPSVAKDYLILNYLSQMLKRINHRLTKKNNVNDYIKDTKEFEKFLLDSNYIKDFDFSFLKTNNKYALLDKELERVKAELYDKYNYKTIRKIEGGYSGAISLLVNKDKELFCKVYNYDVDYNYIRKCLDIYEKLNINSLKLFDYNTLFNGQYTFAIYNFIKGIPLDKYIKEKQLNPNEVQDYGLKVGEVSKKLKNYKEYDGKHFEKISLFEETKSIINGVKTILKDENKKSILNRYISDENMSLLLCDFKKYMESFDDSEINLIHQDLKPANIMIDNDEIYIIDVESMALSHNVFDFKCTITWDLISTYETEMNYLKGYFNGLYNYEIPELLIKQLKYIFLYDFFRSITSLLSGNNLNLTKIDNYVKGVMSLIYDKGLDNTFSYVCENCSARKRVK